MKNRFPTHKHKVLRRFVLFASLVVLQRTIKRGNAFRNALLKSHVTKKPVNKKHHDMVSYSPAVRSPSTPLKMGLDGSGVNDPVPLMSSLLIAAGSTPSQTEPWVQPLSNVLDPFLNFMSFAMLSRVVLSWYPEIIASNTNNNTSNSNSSKDSSQPTETDDITSVMLATESDSSKRPPTTEKASLPIWITLIVIPTQPLLQAVKDVVPPAFGVDITPVFWLAIFTFIHEILLGQQGLLTMKIKYGI